VLAVSLCSALHSSFVIAAEPTRQELWVPTNQLDTVLKSHPNAVLLSPEQYETLIRDAGKTQVAEDPKLAPPKLIAIEGLKLEGKVEPGAASVTLRGEITLQLPSKEWLSTKITWPFAMSRVTTEGNVLAYLEQPKAKKTGPPELTLFAKGPGVAKLHFEAEVPMWLRLRAGERTLEVPDVPFGGVLNLTLPAGVRLLAGSACERSGDAIKVAFDHRGYDDTESSIQQGAPRAFRVRWIESPPTAAPQPLRFSEAAAAEVSASESTLATQLRFGVRMQDLAAREAEIEWQLAGKDTQVTDVSGVAVRRWRQDGAKLFVTLERDGGMHDLTVSLRRLINSIAETGELPLLMLNPPLRTRARLDLAQDLDFLDLTDAKQLERDQFEFQLGVDQPRLVLRTSKPRIESDVDVIARIDKDSVQIERKLVLRSDRPVTEVKVTLPPGEEFITILSAPMKVTEQVQAFRMSIANAAIASPEMPTWRRVGQTLAILPSKPIDPAHPLELSITSRLKLTKAWTGPKNPESITIHQLDIPDAVKVAGYTALNFDDAWRVALKEAKGLEDRDARLTPVKGRMAWFGLREHALTFEVERAEAVFSTEVTAYALPRARTIEIEGQFTLDISGAPLRTFQVKLPVAQAKLLRVTSPLVGEQQLDEATGTWTYTLRQESKGQHNIRWRMSLPSNGGIPAPSAPGTPTASLTATLPHLELPQSRRFAGTWVIEANTDTQLSTQFQNMQPLDVLRVPVVADYQPRHRITSAFTYGAGDNALTITAQRHAHSELAALVVNRMNLLSVLGTDGHSLHEVILDLCHSGEQFVSLHLPQDAELLSTTSGGQAVKPVRSVENAIAIPLPAGSANAPHTLVSVQYRQQKPLWGRSGTQNLEPIRIVGNVPVLSSDWAVFAPAAFGYDKVDTTLEQSHAAATAEDPGFLARLASVLGKPQGRRFLRKAMPASVDFLPGGPSPLLPLAEVPGPRSAPRSEVVEEARQAMDRGDKLFTEGQYDSALGSYKAAIDSLPDATETEDWLNLAKLKYADCSVVVAQERAKQGELDQARQVLDAALICLPGHKAATVMRQQLNDPSRWPSARSPETAKVQAGLLMANSSVEIGNYDAAISQYQDVLRVDPYSSAARRGMENSERRRHEYFKTAYDHQRAKMLSQVAETWEDKVPVQGAAVAFDYGVGRSPGAYLTEKMNKIIFPTVQFQDATLEEAIEYLRVKSRDLDTFTDASDPKGVSLILRTGDKPSNARISLDLKEVPMSEALRYVAELAGMKYKVEPHALVIMPLTEYANAQHTQTFRVPPNFLTASGRNYQTAKQALEASGVIFPEGASATFNPASSQLVVRNTQPNLDLVEALIQSLSNQPLPPPAPSAISYDYGVGRSPGAYLTEKMDKIILPSVQFKNATLEEAIEYLRVKSRDLDTFTDPGGPKGTNIILKSGDSPSNASISLDLKDVRLSEALRYVTELAQMKYKVEAHAVLIVPLSENASEQYTRTYRVRPNFLTAGDGSRITAKQALERAGITFPEGASASYSPTNMTLVVRNTQPNLDLVETFVDSVSKNEMQFKSGLIPLDITLPETGRLLRFHGAQPPEPLALHYISWSQQMLRAVLAMALGLVLFWRLGRRRPWFLTLLVLVLTAWGLPLLLEGSLLALTNALAFGWLCALALHLLGRLFSFSTMDTPVRRSALRNLTTHQTATSLLLAFLALTTALDAEEKSPPPDPAAHTVIIPYDAKLPLDAQKAERFYLGYDDFQRLWKQAKENRRPLPAETDATQQAVIHSALYQGRIEERGLVLETRITATTRGEWTKLKLPFARVENGSTTTPALVGEVRVDGKSAALTDNLLTLEHPGTHAIELTATLPLPQVWNDLTLLLPPSLSGALTLRTPKSDGWLRVNNAAAAAVEEHPTERLFTQSLGNHSSVHLQRSARGLERGEGPVPAATVRGTLTLRELEAETLDADIEFEFPGAMRRTLEFAVDAPAGGGGLEIGTLNTYITLPSAGKVRVPTMMTQTKREGGKLVFTITLRHEVSHGAVMRIEGAQRFLHAAGVRTLPVIQPLAQRVKQEVALLHDDSMKIKVNGGTAQRSTNSNHGALLDAGRWQWSGTVAPTYDVQPAALFAEADVSYVFQLSEQKAELLAALTLKRKRGLWTRAVVGLPAGYEVQAVQGPALTAWQHEGTQLYLQLNPNIAGPEARVVVHLAKVASQPVTTWTLEPLKLENYEKVGGKALIVAHAASDIKLPDPTQLKDLKELDPTALDSVFAIAPPMEKKRALQHEGTAWTVDVTLTRQASRFSADTVLLVLASDAGIRISQQVVALVEQGAVRQLSIRLPAALPEAVVSGPLLRETRSHLDGTERVYECSLQTEVLDRAELTFDLDLPLTAELDVPFVKVADASRLTRWFVLDNASAREAKIIAQTAQEEVAREAVPYLPASLARPKYFRATGDGTLKLAYQQLTSTEGTAALITLADLTTVLRPDGTRWDIAQYSLINRSLQFLPVILPDQAELISVSVSGEPVRADEETQGGRRVRLIPLIHTRPGQRALEVKIIYRFPEGGGLQQTAKLDDPEIVGLSVERTTWTVWTPQGWKLKDFDGNMTATAAEGRELLQLEGMLSELGEANRALSSGKLDYGDAEAAYRDANALAEMVQQKKRELMSKTGRGTLTLSGSIQPSGMDTEVRQQQELLKGNWDNNYANRKRADKSSKNAGQTAQEKTAWGFNGAAPQEPQLRLAGNNTFTGSVTTNGGQLFNDNVAVDNAYFANGQLLPPINLNGPGGASPYPYGGGPITAGMRSGGYTIDSTSTANVTAQNYGNNGAQILTQNSSGSVNIVNSNARSNNLGNGAAATTQTFSGTILGSGGVLGTDVQVNGMKFNSSPPLAGSFRNLNERGNKKPAPAAPAMAADPFAAPAPAPPPTTADPFAAPAAAVDKPMAKDAVRKAIPVDDDGKEQRHMLDERPVTLAQTVESLRPTGRRALGIELPLDGTTHHFSKLKDHAVLEVAIQRMGDPKTTSRLLCLSGGLLLWLAIGWKLKRRSQAV
jgi:tetratricopeptide (TPR) repeat protein